MDQPITPIRPVPQNHIDYLNHLLQGPMTLAAQTSSFIQSPLEISSPLSTPLLLAGPSTPITDRLQNTSAFSPYQLCGTPKRPKDLNKYRKEFCYICNDVISIIGKRSQGPRRHIVQKHLKTMLFRCPHCSHGSVYDRHHVLSHMKRVHGDHSDKVISGSDEAEAEIQSWYEKCFIEPKDALENINPVALNMNAQPPILQQPLLRSPFTPINQGFSIINPYATPDTTPTRRAHGFMIKDIIGKP